MGLRLKFRFSTLHLMDVFPQTRALFRYLLPLRIIPSALRLFLLMFLCFSLIPSAAGDIAHHGSSTIVYNEATHHGKALDKVAMSVGGECERWHPSRIIHLIFVYGLPLLIVGPW